MWVASDEVSWNQEGASSPVPLVNSPRVYHVVTTWLPCGAPAYTRVHVLLFRHLRTLCGLCMCVCVCIILVARGMFPSEIFDLPYISKAHIIHKQKIYFAIKHPRVIIFTQFLESTVFRTLIITSRYFASSRYDMLKHSLLKIHTYWTAKDFIEQI